MKIEVGNKVVFTNTIKEFEGMIDSIGTNFYYIKDDVGNLYGIKREYILRVVE